MTSAHQRQMAPGFYPAEQFGRLYKFAPLGRTEQRRIPQPSRSTPAKLHGQSVLGTSVGHVGRVIAHADRAASIHELDASTTIHEDFRRIAVIDHLGNFHESLRWGAHGPFYLTPGPSGRWVAQCRNRNNMRYTSGAHPHKSFFGLTHFVPERVRNMRHASVFGAQPEVGIWSPAADPPIVGGRP